MPQDSKSSVTLHAERDDIEKSAPPAYDGHADKGEINLCSVTQSILTSAWGARIRKQCSLVSFLNILYVLLKRTGKRLYLELLNEECSSAQKTILLKYCLFLSKILAPIFPAWSWDLPPNIYLFFLKTGGFQRGKGTLSCVSLFLISSTLPGVLFPWGRQPKVMHQSYLVSRPLPSQKLRMEILVENPSVPNRGQEAGRCRGSQVAHWKKTSSLRKSYF